MAKKTATTTKANRVPATAVLVAAIDDLLGLQKDMEGKVKSKKDKGLSTEELTAIRHYEEGLQKTLDLIAPAGMAVEKSEIMLNEKYARTMFIYNWPSFAYPNWMSQEINYDAEIDFAQFIYPASNKVIMKMLRKKVAEMRSTMRIMEQRGIVRDPALEAALQDAEELRDLLARGREKLYQLGVYITIYADDKEKLKKLQTDMESLLGGKLMLTKPAVFQMEHGFTSTVPLCVDELEINRNMNTSPIATSFPFSSPDLTDDHGILYGINRHNDSLIIFDRFDLPNANATVFATSGAGKSFTVKLEILRSMMMGTDVFVIDPENEYSELCKTVGGTFIPISLQSSWRINPFDLPKAIRGEDAQVGEVLRAAVINLHGLFKLMLGTLTPAEDGILDKSILDTYALKNITLETENPGDFEPPTLNDLVDVLMTTEGGENMAQTLKKYTEGSFAGLFNQPTNVELENQMIVFQIRDLEDQLRPIAIYVVLNFLWNRIRADFKKRLLIIDEAWNLMQHEDSARFLYGLIKRARKYYLGITTITQDVEDFVNSPYGKPIITNASLQILLKQSPTAVDNLQKLFYLTDGEKYLLLNSDVGQGIFFAGNKHVAIQVIASPAEEQIITTKPEDVMAKLQEAKSNQEIHANQIGLMMKENRSQKQTKEVQKSKNASKDNPDQPQPEEISEEEVDTLAEQIEQEEMATPPAAETTPSTPTPEKEKPSKSDVLTQATPTESPSDQPEQPPETPPENSPPPAPPSI